MEVKAKDTYKIEMTDSLSDDSFATLCELYQPLIGADGLLLYLTLASEARLHSSYETHGRLFTLMNMDPAVFDRACAKLEEFMLMRIYEKEDTTKNQYVYVLNRPLSPKDFSTNGIFMNMYTDVMGVRNRDNTMTRFFSGDVSKEGFRDVTRPARYSSGEKYRNTEVFTKLKPRYHFSNDDTIVFDYDTFTGLLNAATFPVSARTQENLYLIGKLATVFGLSPETMKTLCEKSYNFTTGKLSTTNLEFLAKSRSPEKNVAKDVYMLPPKSFLQSKQNGAEVSRTDSEILLKLSRDMNFSNEVINVLIEYILNISQNRLNPNFVDMVAGEWARDGVTTREQAILETRKSVNYKSGRGRTVRKVDMPEYMKDTETAAKEKKKASDEMLQKAREKQKKMKE